MRERSNKFSDYNGDDFKLQTTVLLILVGLLFAISCTLVFYCQEKSSKKNLYFKKEYILKKKYL